MSRNRRVALSLSAAAIVLSLVGLGITFRATWDSFIPDILIGVVGAGVIAAAVFLASERAADRRIRAADVASAYNRLMDALTPLRTLDPHNPDEVENFSNAATRMMQLADAADDDRMRVWFEAERQLALHRLLQTSALVSALSDEASSDERLAARAPFLEWVAEFGGNVRHWRVNGGSLNEMLPHAAKIEERLRGVGAWRADHYPWRTEGPRDI